MNQRPPSRREITDALDAILDSDEFRCAPLRSKFLQFVVNETLEGRADRLKGATIAFEVYARGADFDPQIDPIVRVEARRIRRDLEHYYLTAGVNDEVVIRIPKGGYVPTFERDETAPQKAEVGNHAERSVDPTVKFRAANATEDNSAISPSFSASGKARALVVGFVCLAALLVAVVWWSARDSEPHVTSSLEVKLYVLPFEPTVLIPEEQALAKGITVEIIDQLSPFKGIEVHPTSATYSLASMLDEAGGQVAFTLDGFVQIVGSDVRITAILQRVADGRHVWSDSFTENYTPQRVFEIQDQIARSVIGQLAETHGILGEVTLQEISASPSPSLRAYECVLLGYRYRATFPQDLHGTARDCLEEVVDETPDYARAWSLLAHVYVDEYRYFYNTRPNAQGRAVEAGQRAVALAPEDALSHQAASIALYNAGRTEEALAAARKAVELNPHNYVALMQLGYRMFAAGRWDEATRIVDEAIRETLSPPVWFPWVKAILHIREGDFEAARTLLEPINAPQLALVSATQAAVYGQLGMTENAAFALDRTRQLDPEFDTRAREWFANQQFPDELLEVIMAGLVKAGL